MRQIFLVLISLITISCCGQKTKETKFNEKESLEVKVKLIRSFDSTYLDYGTRKMFEIRLTVINKSRNTIKYWNMCCSWQDIFIINTDYINFDLHGCSKNFPKIYSLKSCDSLSIKTRLIRNDKILNEPSPFFIKATKIGFLYIDTIRCKTYRDFMPFMCDRSLQNKVFWSNPLYLSDIK